jgi:hypothetical protein
MNYFFRIWHDFIESGTKAQFEYITLLSGILATFYYTINKISKYFIKKSVIKEIDFLSTDEIADCTNYFIETRFSKKPIGRIEDEDLDYRNNTSSDLLARYFLKNLFISKIPKVKEKPGLPDRIFSRLKKTYLFQIFSFEEDDPKVYKYILLLGESGMGKTSFLINLLLKYKAQKFRYFGLIRLFSAPQKKIYFLPFRNENLFEYIKSIKEKTNSHLLLDALDEDVTSLDVKERLQQIYQATYDFKTVVMTCRIQFFESYFEEPELSGIKKYGVNKGEHGVHRLYIKPFNKSDIEKYLRLKFRSNKTKQKISSLAVLRFRNILMRPLILSYIDEIVDEISEESNEIDVYRLVISKWIKREAVLYSDPVLFEDKLLQFSKKVALFFFEKALELKSRIATVDEILILAKQFNVDLNRLELKSRSLLTRDINGHYSFSHKSFYEYFIALNILDDPALYKLNDMRFFDRALFFVGNHCLELIKKENDGIVFEFDYFTFEGQLGHCDNLLTLDKYYFAKPFFIKFDDKLFSYRSLKYCLLMLPFLRIFRQNIYANRESSLIDILEETVQLLKKSLKTGDYVSLQSIQLAIENKEKDIIWFKSNIKSFLDFEKRILDYMAF